MIIMPVKEGENIERALKKFKRKYERTGVLKELRRRQYFTKPSIAKRVAKQHAIYVENMYRDEDLSSGVLHHIRPGPKGVGLKNVTTWFIRSLHLCIGE